MNLSLSRSFPIAKAALAAAVIACTFALACSLTGCASGGTDSSSADADNTSASTDGKTLRVAMELAYPPFETKDDAGNPEGLAVDFIREDEQFQIWHMQDLTDIDSPCGQNWGLPPEKLPEQAVFAPIAALHDPEPNVKRCLRRLYTPERDFSPPPELPRPYETFAETFSYGYEEDAT